MKKLFLIIAALSAFVSSAFSADSKASKQSDAPVQPAQVLSFNNDDFKIDQIDVRMTPNVDKVMVEMNRPGMKVTLMKATWRQWELLQKAGVRLASLTWGEGDIQREWIEMKFGYVGPILTALDGLPGFVLKDKKGNWVWSYNREEISNAAPTFWIAIDVTYTEQAISEREATQRQLAAKN